MICASHLCFLNRVHDMLHSVLSHHMYDLFIKNTERKGWSDLKKKKKFFQNFQRKLWFCSKACMNAYRAHLDVTEQTTKCQQSNLNMHNDTEASNQTTIHTCFAPACMNNGWNHWFICLKLVFELCADACYNEGMCCYCMFWCGPLVKHKTISWISKSKTF